MVLNLFGQGVSQVVTGDWGETFYLLSILFDVHPQELEAGLF